MPGNADGSGFVSLQQYLDANQPAVDATAKRLVSNANQNAATASAEGDQVGQNAMEGFTQHGAGYDPTTAEGFSQAQSDLQNASDQTRGLSNDGGLQDQLTKQVNGQYQGQTGSKFGLPANTPAYSTGDAAFDASLVGGQVKTAAAGRFGGLDDYLTGSIGKAKDAGMTNWEHNQPSTVPQYAGATVGAPGMGGPGNQSRPGGQPNTVPAGSFNPPPPTPDPTMPTADTAGQVVAGYHPKHNREGDHS